MQNIIGGDVKGNSNVNAEAVNLKLVVNELGETVVAHFSPRRRTNPAGEF